MSFKSKLKGMRKPYGARQEGTYQTRDTSHNQHVSAPKVAVHEELTPDNPFNPLINHQGAPVYDPVTPASPTSDTDSARQDADGTDIDVKVHLEPWEENMAVGCVFFIIALLIVLMIGCVISWITGQILH